MFAWSFCRSWSSIRRATDAITGLTVKPHRGHVAMRTLSGAIIILAGAIVFGAAIVGQEVCQASKNNPDAAPGFGFFFGIVLWLTGVVMTVARYPYEDRRPPDRPL